jgi:hypothetical protein
MRISAHPGEQAMTDLEDYLDRYVSATINPQGRRELAAYLEPRIAAAARIDPVTCEIIFNGNSGKRRPNWPATKPIGQAGSRPI